MLCCIIVEVICVAEAREAVRPERGTRRSSVPLGSATGCYFPSTRRSDALSLSRSWRVIGSVPNERPGSRSCGVMVSGLPLLAFFAMLVYSKIPTWSRHVRGGKDAISICHTDFCRAPTCVPFSKCFCCLRTYNFSTVLIGVFHALGEQCKP